MRKRCFIIAGVALIFGLLMMIFSFPSQKELEDRYAYNKSAEKLNNWAREDGRRPTLSYMDDGPNSVMLTTSYVSFGLAGVLLIVGFIIGPSKE